jgi:tetrahydromethanopterin S-methyltransferase subunit F
VALFPAGPGQRSRNRPSPAAPALRPFLPDTGPENVRDGRLSCGDYRTRAGTARGAIIIVCLVAIIALGKNASSTSASPAYLPPADWLATQPRHPACLPAMPAGTDRLAKPERIHCQPWPYRVNGPGAGRNGACFRIPALRSVPAERPAEKASWNSRLRCGLRVDFPQGFACGFLHVAIAVVASVEERRDRLLGRPSQRAQGVGRVVPDGGVRVG